MPLKKKKHAASCNVAGSCAAVAAPQATSSSSTCASLDSVHKWQRLLHRSEHAENVGAAGAHHGSGTFDSTDSPTVRTIERPRNSLSVRGMGKGVRAQVDAFIRFAVSFVRERQDQRVMQSDLIAAYTAAHETGEDIEEASARVRTDL